jgi:hypothetical protein
MTDVTATWAPKIAMILTTNDIVETLNFPSLTFGHRAYAASDYRRVGDVMGRGKIEVYAETGGKFKASYTNAKGGDYFVINTEHFDAATFSKDPAQIAVIVHESTHMVQDDKRLRMSNCERELDAHFAQALYLVRAGAAELYDKVLCHEDHGGGAGIRSRSAIPLLGGVPQTAGRRARQHQRALPVQHGGAERLRS